MLNPGFVRALCVLASLTLVSCGGGSGGSSAGSGPPPGAPSPAPDAYPVLVKSPGFSLPDLPAPPESVGTAGSIVGRVFSSPGTPVAAGIQVDLLDASDPAAPRIVASTTTAADGSYALPGALTIAPPTANWVRAGVDGGTPLRAFATAIADISPGSEVAVGEVTRLLRSGGLLAAEIDAQELRAAQESVSLYWEGTSAATVISTAIDNVRTSLRTQAAWNRFLRRLANAGPSAAAGDVAGLMPVPAARWSVDVTETTNGVTTTRSAELLQSCQLSIPLQPDSPRQCTLYLSSGSNLLEVLRIDDAGIHEAPVSPSSPIAEAVAVAGAVTHVEFPYRSGTRVLYENPRVNVRSDGSLLASVRIVRRTYPIESIQALGRSVRAIPVVFDYEVAVRFPATGVQIDLLQRETRWFAPQAGRVRIAADGKARDASGGVAPISAAISIAARSFAGPVFGSTVEPFAGAADTVASALRHRHATYSPALDRVYVAVEAGGGRVLELDPASLQVSRSLNIGAVPGQVAVALDGSRLYVGLDGGRIAEYRTVDFTRTRLFDLPPDLGGRVHDRVDGLGVDPFDPARILVVAGDSTVFGGRPAVLVFNAGTLVLRDAPSPSGTPTTWDWYSPGRARWTTVRDEFVTANNLSPSSMYRFRLGGAAGSVAEIAARQRVYSVGETDFAGTLITGDGTLLDSVTFNVLRSFAAAPFPLTDCMRVDAGVVICTIRSAFAQARPFLVHLDFVDSAFRGTYQSTLTSASNGCPEILIGAGTFGLQELSFIPMDGRRLLVSALSDGSRSRCSLQVWTLRGL